MRTYFLCIIFATVISSLCTSLVHGSSMEKYVKYICSLICVAAIIIPFGKAISDGFDISPTDVKANISKTSDEYFVSASSAQIKNYISTIIANKFGIFPDDVSIEMESTDKEVIIKSIKVILPYCESGKAEEISGYLLDVLGEKVDVE